MPASLAGKAVVVIGDGSPEHRGVVVALAEAGADLAVAGAPGLASEVRLNSIANEVWALGRRSLVVTYVAGEAASYAKALAAARDELGRLDIVLRCDPVRDV